MADFNGPINYLGYIGAKVMTNLDEKNPQKPYVCIPLPENDLKYTAANGNYPARVDARLDVQELGDAYAQAVIRSDEQARLTDPTKKVRTREEIEYFRVTPNFRKEFVLSIIKARITNGKIDDLKQKAAEAYYRKDEAKRADLLTQDPTDDKSRLFWAIKAYMQDAMRLGKFYRTQYPQLQQTAPVPQYGAATGATAYVAPAQEEDPFSAPWESQADSDLPF